MDGHFRAFTFVDRITSVQTGVQARGGYVIPTGVDVFPQALATEAVGQLAAWVAMAAVDFKFRPVAGLAGKVDLLSHVRPGQILELTAEIETVDKEAVDYGGTAHVDGVPVVRVEHCVGPMLPIEEFDDPQAIRERYALLCGPGATPGGFAGMPPLALNRTDGETGQCSRATLQVPVAGDFFEDHFPRRPVFPGTLFMHLILQLASSLAAEIPAPANGARWTATAVSHAKLRTFIPPGDLLEFEAKLDKRTDDTLVISVVGKKDNKVVGGNRVLFSTRERS